MSDSESDNEDNYKERRKQSIAIGYEILENLWRQQLSFNIWYNSTISLYIKRKDNQYVKNSKLVRKFHNIKLPIKSEKGRENLANKYENYVNLCKKVNRLLCNYKEDPIHIINPIANA